MDFLAYELNMIGGRELWKHWQSRPATKSNPVTFSGAYIEAPRQVEPMDSAVVGMPGSGST